MTEVYGTRILDVDGSTAWARTENDSATDPAAPPLNPVVGGLGPIARRLGGRGWVKRMGCCAGEKG